jgi:hypothetical protein
MTLIRNFWQVGFRSRIIVPDPAFLIKFFVNLCFEVDQFGFAYIKVVSL